ncbi:uncharacterized protein C8Q71DRAFT_854469 [Rhodofomes roseus]|uniref:Uncharacterized protein n=1 Tax=Rhodofomes roseus TaxID=34475 RepID=A0ABQ8KPZ9_9APHY|nr:uncharacterized protein C8Q71DRAFT_854469 [Rhodofomes roseus]KAH9840585.1 hypothetical protein C8Q71DRAFT_854469 [Rhodofomes roseus]
MSSSIHAKSAVQNTATDLPPSRDRKGLRSVSPPLSNVPISRFNYLLALLATVVAAFYVWRLMQWKAEVGGWWNLALGKRPPQLRNRDANTGAQWANAGAHAQSFAKDGGDGEVERRIEELAVALGIPSKDLANAIAGAVRDFVPPASLSSIAAHETGEAVEYMVDPSGASASEAQSAPGATASRGFRVMENAFQAAVGMDEPPTEV